MSTNAERPELGLPTSCDVSVEKFYDEDEEERYWRMEWVDPETAHVFESELEVDYYSRREAMDSFIDSSIPSERNWLAALERRRQERGF